MVLSFGQNKHEGGTAVTVMVFNKQNIQSAFINIIRGKLTF